MSVLTAEQLLLVDVPVDAEPEEGSLQWAKREFAKFLEFSQVHGGLVTQSQAALILGITRQAVAEYVRRGHLTLIDVLEGKYIGANELLAFATREKLKGGRPSKLAVAKAAWDRG